MNAQVRIEELSAATIAAVNSLGLKPGQEQFITPVSYAAAAAVIPVDSAWQRVALIDNRVVGFIHANFDADNRKDEFKAALWRINVDADSQGQGVGTKLLTALLEEAKTRGIERLTVLWERGENSPEAFFLRMGFQPRGETEFGEVIGAFELSQLA